MEYLKAEYRRLIRLLCEKYNQVVAQDILHKANSRASNKDKEVGDCETQ